MSYLTRLTTGLLVAAGLGLASPVVPASAAPVSQCVSTAIAGGTADALTVPKLPCTPTTSLLILAFSQTNLTTSPTLQVIGQTAPLPIVYADGSPMGVGSLGSGHSVILTSNGSNWAILTVPASAASGINQLTGDATAGPGGGSQALTLGPSGIAAAMYGDPTHAPQCTFDIKGRSTLCTNVLITPAFGSLTGNIAIGQMNNGTGASPTTFWRGDGAWATPAGSGTVGNAQNLSNHAPVIGDGGATGIKTTAALTNGQIVCGVTGADPTACTVSADATLAAGGALTIANLAVSTAKLADAAVTNAKLATMGAHTYKGNNTSGTGAPLDLTATQLTGELSAFVGDSGAGGTKGLTPAPAAGDGVAGKFLNALGGWSVPPGGGGGTSNLTSAHIFVGNGINVATDVAMSGDATMVVGGAVSVLKWAGATLGDTTPTTAHIMIANGSLWGSQAISGDMTLTSAGSLTIGANAVTNSKLATMAGNTIKGNNTGSPASALDLTATQATAMLNAFVGDSGSGGTKGMVPSPASGDAAAGKFLKANGTFAVPPGTGGCPAGVQTWDGTGDLTVSAGTGLVYTTGSTPIASGRALLLPTVASYVVGCSLVVVDLAGLFNSTNVVTPTRQSSDTIDGNTVGSLLAVASQSVGYTPVAAATWSTSDPPSIESLTADAHSFMTGLGTNGKWSRRAPDFADNTGNIAVSQMNSGNNASSTTFWAGNGTWATPAGGGGGVGVVGGGGQSAIAQPPTYSYVSYQPGHLAAVSAVKSIIHRPIIASYLDRISASAIEFTCSVNPTITFLSCSDTSCSSSPTTLGTVTVTASGTTVDGTISSPVIAQNNYIGASMTAGTCTALNLAGSLSIHSAPGSCGYAETAFVTTCNSHLIAALL